MRLENIYRSSAGLWELKWKVYIQKFPNKSGKLPLTVLETKIYLIFYFNVLVFCGPFDVLCVYILVLYLSIMGYAEMLLVTKK